MTNDTRDKLHEDASAKLEDIAETVEAELPDGVHFALVIATQNEAGQMRTAHVTTMNDPTLINVLLGHAGTFAARQLSGQADLKHEPNPGHA